MARNKCCVNISSVHELMCLGILQKQEGSPRRRRVFLGTRGWGEAGLTGGPHVSSKIFLIQPMEIILWWHVPILQNIKVAKKIALGHLGKDLGYHSDFCK